MLTVLGFTALAGAGAGLRFLATDRWPGGHRGTLVVNVVGSLALGLLVGTSAPVPVIVGVGGLVLSPLSRRLPPTLSTWRLTGRCGPSDTS